MSQTLRGIRRILNVPRVYDVFQSLVGDQHARKAMQDRFIQSLNTDTVLDIGCGTGSMARYLNYSQYVGFDPSERYIQKGRERCYPNSTFIVGDARAVLPEIKEQRFDIVLMVGVLHHLDDQTAISTLKVARQLMGHTARLVTIDPCVDEKSSWIAQRLVAADRGMAIRSLDGVSGLAKQVFPEVNAEICRDLLRIPYSHVVMMCES